MDQLAQKNGDIRPFEVTHRMVISLAVPMTLAYLTTPVLGLVDTAVVGRFNSAALIGGLAVGSILLDVIFTTFNFQRSGTTGLTAQAFGAGDGKEIHAILFRALLLAAGAGVVTIAAAPFLVAAGLWFMAPGEEVALATRQYFLIRIWSTPFALANYAFLGWLIGLGRSGTGLLLQLLLNGVNIVLSIYLGLYLGYGIAGVAWATVIAEMLATGAGAVIAWQLRDRGEPPSWRRISDLAAIRRLVNLNGDIMIRSFVLLSAFAFFTAQGARFGEVTLAANAILLQFMMIAGYFLDGMATAAEQIVGRSIGARHRPAFVRGLFLSLLWNCVLAIALALLFWMLGHQIIDLITTNRPVRDEAYSYLYLAAFTPLTGVLAFQLDGVFIGATWSREMSRMMLLSFAVYVSAYWFGLASWGNVGLWFALHLFFISRGVTLGAMVPRKLKQTFAS
jgi:MATE family, multidrug efflux pump